MSLRYHGGLSISDGSLNDVRGWTVSRTVSGVEGGSRESAKVPYAVNVELNT